MQSGRRGGQLPPPPPIPAASGHGRSPSVSSTSSTSSARSSSRMPFTNFSNSSTSTITLIPPTTPRPPSRSAAHTAPPGAATATQHTSPRAAIANHQLRQGPGYFEPTLTHPAQAPPAQQPSQVAAAYAMHSSMRKRSATEPSPATPPIQGSVMSHHGVAGAAANMVYSSLTTAAVNIPQVRPHTQQSSSSSHHGLNSPSTSAPTQVASKKEGKMKIFGSSSKPGRIGTPGIDKALRPLPSPNKLGQISAPIPRLTPMVSKGLDDSRKPSFSSLASGFSASSTLVNTNSEVNSLNNSFNGNGINGGYPPNPVQSYSGSPPLIERGFKELSLRDVERERDLQSRDRERDRDNNPLGQLGQLNKTLHRPHFLRSRDKDHHHHSTFSSSASNSKMADTSNISLYSFGPSSPSTKSDLPKSSDLTLKTSKALKSALGASYEEPLDLTAQDAWPFLCSRVLPLFVGEPLRSTVEDLNKQVTLHIRRCVERRDPIQLLADIRQLLETGMSNIEPQLSKLPDERLLTRLVEIWQLVFGYTTPYLEAVLLPLQQEFKGSGTVLKPHDAREFFGSTLEITPLGLDVRRLIMIAVRDCIVLPIFDRLKMLFSRLQMDFSRNQEEGMEVVGRMLQCVSILAAAGTGDEKQGLIDELGRTLKWNWLSRRTGRNRRGFVGTKMRVVV
ncbi:Similar to Target of rapamycin complex 2 subunit bit61; acc. no. O74547 [Pyronema omphalodes CBS 100304]|uniref:Similar to Target of rapamycin complex 2 subunit bit61 acc. no. O74547 n=1 Tax=Pyronema omphalodes (strain CBS 100304) TaxID=1076935 RepID=U4KUA8_PYROM|nr:Similar to Target of rapamycin complex 2 subunit bit61; acc. no. O74547 [Pyronema omphalodes CBS 100304]